MNGTPADAQSEQEIKHAIPRIKPTALGHLVKQIRESRDWSYREMWKATGVHYTTLAQMERGEIRPTARIVQKLATALNLQGPARDKFITAGMLTTRRLLGAAKVGQLELLQLYLAGLDRAKVSVDQVGTASVTTLNDLAPAKRQQLISAWKQGLEDKLKLLNTSESSLSVMGMVITTKAGKRVVVDVVLAAMEG